MSDAEIEKLASTEDEEFADSSSNVTHVKSRVKRDASTLRHPRQKYCGSWETLFPWLKADKIDESLGICTICNKTLVCKKSHLERHQASFKHQRTAGFDVVKPDITLFLDCGNERGNSCDEFEFEKLDMEETSDIPVKAAKNVKTRAMRSTPKAKEAKPTISKPTIHRAHKEERSKLNRLKLLKRIDKDRNELNEYYYSRQRLVSPNQLQLSTPQQRDTFDLFFESVSASVKQLPPKLAAEVKSKVSQLLTEFEIRAICEKEALENSVKSVSESNIIFTPKLNDSPQPVHVTAAIDASSMPLVYTFQKS